MPKSKRHPARRPQQRTARRPHTPRPTAARAPQPAQSEFRRRLERASAPPLLAMHRLHRLVIPFVLAAFLVVGLWLPWRIAAVLVLFDAVFVAWLLALSWPLLGTLGRVLRVATVIALVLAATLRMAGVY
ncbi:MAG TPA: DUF6703 family protein [Pedococcus sp.]|nr:DUF6703 family protein [Pedococcus sp.]